MHGHHDDAVGIFFVAIQVGIEGDLLQKSFQRRHHDFRLLVRMVWVNGWLRELLHLLHILDDVGL